MNHYYVAVRRKLRIARGTEIVTTGDGILARFDAPGEAIRCAVEIRQAVRTLGLEIRAGLHAGEYESIGNEVVGLALHIGTRVAAKAGPSEVLVSNTLKELVADPIFKFRDRGMHTLKGVPDRWRLYAVEP
jgi:class 3 adenylate cyclase